MPLPTLRAVYALGITHVQRLEHPLQSVVGCGDGNQVNVISHQTISEYFNLEFLAILLEPGQIRLTVFVRKENVLASITALRDVVWNTGKNDSG